MDLSQHLNFIFLLESGQRLIFCLDIIVGFFDQRFVTLLSKLNISWYLMNCKNDL